MPRPPKTELRAMTAGQSNYVLNRLLSERKINQSDINRCLGCLDDEIRELESRLASLRQAHETGEGSSSARPQQARPQQQARTKSAGRQTVASTAPSAGTAEPARRGRKPRRKPVSAETAASRKLQGQYLALIRQIPATKRETYRKIAQKDGREAAIAKMREVVK